MGWYSVHARHLVRALNHGFTGGSAWFCAEEGLKGFEPDP